MMAEPHTNFLLLDRFLDTGVEGVTIGSNDLTQLYPIGTKAVVNIALSGGNAKALFDVDPSEEFRTALGVPKKRNVFQKGVYYTKL